MDKNYFFVEDKKVSNENTQESQEVLDEHKVKQPSSQQKQFRMEEPEVVKKFPTAFIAENDPQAEEMVRTWYPNATIVPVPPAQPEHSWYEGYTNSKSIFRRMSKYNK